MESSHLLSPSKIAHMQTPGISIEGLPLAQQSAGNASQLVQQGRELYEAGRFSNAATVLQQAALEFEAQGDKLRQAAVLSNLSLTYQQLGLWPQAAQAITACLSLMQPGRDERISKGRLQLLGQV